VKAWILKELKWLAWAAFFILWLEQRRIEGQYGRIWYEDSATNESVVMSDTPPRSPGLYVSFILCENRNGERYTVRHVASGYSPHHVQEDVIKKLSDPRSLPMGSDSAIRSIETVLESAILKNDVQRRDVPLFELKR